MILRQVAAKVVERVADRLFEEAIATLAALPDRRARSQGRLKVVEALAEVGRRDSALALARAIEVPARQAEALGAVALALRWSDSDEAATLLAEAVYVARTIPRTQGAIKP